MAQPRMASTGARAAPLEVAGERLDDAVPLLTGDPTSNADALVHESAEWDELETDRELLRRNARALAAAVIAVGDAFLLHPETITRRPGDVAVLVRGLTACVQAVSNAFVQAANLKTAQPEADDATAG
jgi:hypothetical protein